MDGSTGGKRSRVVRHAGAFGIATLASRALGMVRDMVIAALFTATATDAFFVAFTIPNVLRRLFGEGSLNAAVVPVYTEVDLRGRAEAVRFARVLLGAWLVILVAVSIAGVAAAPLLVDLYAWGFRVDPEKYALTVLLARIMFPYILCMGLVALATGVVNVHGRFFVPAFSPFLWNLAMVVCGLALAPVLQARGLQPVLSIAGGVVLGGVLQVLWQLPALKTAGRLVLPALDFGNGDLRKVFRLMLPMTLGFGVYQINILLSRLFASFLPEGSVSYLYYGMRVVDVPQAVFLLAIGAAVLPALSRAAAEDRTADLKRAYSDALALSLFIAIPAAAAIVILAEPIASVLFLRGRFDATMLEPTALTMACMAPGIVGVAGVRVTTPAFFARADTRTPTVIGAVNLVIYVAACLALMGPFGHLGIAAAISIAPIAQCVHLIIELRRRVGPLGLRGVTRSAVRALVGTGAMLVVLYFLAPFGRWEDAAQIGRNVVVLAACVGGGAAVYLFVTRLIGSRELGTILDALRRRT